MPGLGSNHHRSRYHSECSSHSDRPSVGWYAVLVDRWSQTTTFCLSWPLSQGSRSSSSQTAEGISDRMRGVSCHSSLDQGLTVIHKCVGQRVASGVANRERLPLPFDHDVHPPGVSRDRTGANRAAHAHAMARLGTVQRKEFRNGVIGLLLFRAHHEFGLLLHGSSSRTLILRPWSHSGGQSVTVRVTDTFTCVPGAVIFIVPLYTPGPSPRAFTSTIGLLGAMPLVNALGLGPGVY